MTALKNQSVRVLPELEWAGQFLLIVEEGLLLVWVSDVGSGGVLMAECLFSVTVSEPERKQLDFQVPG